MAGLTPPTRHSHMLPHPTPAISRLYAEGRWLEILPTGPAGRVALIRQILATSCWSESAFLWTVPGERGGKTTGLPDMYSCAVCVTRLYEDTVAGWFNRLTDSWMEQTAGENSRLIILLAATYHPAATWRMRENALWLAITGPIEMYRCSRT